MFFLKKCDFFKLSKKEVKHRLSLAILRVKHKLIEEAVGDFSDYMYKFFDSEGFSIYGTHFKVENKFIGNDALVGFLTFRKYFISKLPFLKKIMAMVFRYPRVVYISPEKVSFIVPFYKQCPVMKDKDIPLASIEKFCKGLFARGCFARPDIVQIIKSVNPDLKWELESFREQRHLPCIYSIMYTGKVKFDYNPSLLREVRKFSSSAS